MKIRGTAAATSTRVLLFAGDFGLAPSQSTILRSYDPLLEDTAHSQSEPRIHALGKTDEGRALHITFTLRSSGTQVRVISARDMHRKERTFYEQANQD